MHEDKLEKALDDFLQRREYDAAEAALYDIVRAAFYAGVRAAGGEMPQEQKPFAVLAALDRDTENGILE